MKTKTGNLTKNVSKGKTFNLSKQGFTIELYNFIKKYYNTGNEVLFYNDKEKRNNKGFKVLNTLYDGIITLSTQGTGTETQKQTYLNIQIVKFIEMLKKINNQ